MLVVAHLVQKSGGKSGYQATKKSPAAHPELSPGMLLVDFLHHL